MRKHLPFSGCSLIGLACLSGLAACAKSPPSQAGAPADGGHPDSTTSLGDGGQACTAGPPSSSYVLIDDMETTTHGPITLDTGILPPLSPGYWYNSGAAYSPDGGGAADMSNPPQGSFSFSALPAPSKTLNCKASAHAARQFCMLNGLYDTCGVGFEFVQEPDRDAGVAPSGDAGSGDAGDAGPSGPRVTIPFDISRYKAIKFWGMTTTPDPTTGSLPVKVQFPDTDTDPRGEVCNGAGPNISKCYNSYASNLSFTTTWQEFTVALDTGDGGVPAGGGIAIDPSWGYQQAQWIPTQVYGVNWQAQRNTAPDSGPPLMTDIWIDDVYFVK